MIFLSQMDTSSRLEEASDDRGSECGKQKSYDNPRRQLKGEERGYGGLNRAANDRGSEHD